MSKSNEKASRRRPRLAISLRLFAIMILMICGWMGWEVHRARTLRRAVTTILGARGRIFREGRFTGGDLWAPEWLTSRSAPEYFFQIRSVSFTMKPVPEEVYPALRVLGEFESFEIFYSEITDESLARLSQSVRARELKLWATKGVTSAGLTHLASCSSLEKLTVRFGGLGSTASDRPEAGDAWLARLAELPRLRSLALAGIPIGDAGIANLGNLSGLRELDLSCPTDLSAASLAALKQFPALRRLKLNMFHTRPGDFAALRQLPVALELTVPVWDAIDVESPLMRTIGRLERLDRLTLYSSPLCGELSGDFWTRLEMLPNLRELKFVSGTLRERDWEGIARLGKLERLAIEQTKGVRAGVKHICKMDWLKELDCRYSSLSALEIAQVQQALPSLEISH